MGVFTKLCPFRFANPDVDSLGGLCVESLCAWYNEKDGKCVVAPQSVAKPATAPKPKTTRKKAVE